MSTPLHSRFIFVTCQVGAEAALKREVTREHPDLHFSYSRPGFVTFKAAQGEMGPDFELKSVFARAYGINIRRFNSISELKKQIEELGISDLHIWERDQHPSGEEPLGFEPGHWTQALLSGLQLGNTYRVNQAAQPGQMILDLIAVQENEFWLGVHLHQANHHPHPGGKPSLTLPSEAPSRAYLKLEEGIIWSQLPLRQDDVAVEVGSAPGGASYALLQRGLRVIGIDPGKMDPVVLKSDRFRHIAKSVTDVAAPELLPPIHWVLLDMNVNPQISLFAVDRITAITKKNLLGVLFTVKLNDWALADQIPGMLDHVKSMGMTKVRATQLASNKQEICIYGITRLGAQRLNSAALS